jgi:dethiobiotin synthase
MRGRGLFVAGTGTGVGKTVVAAGLLRMLRSLGIDAAPMKPVQTGAVLRADGAFEAPDLEVALSAAGRCASRAQRERMAPCCYEPACSPHLAARLAGRPVDLEHIVESAQWLADRHQALVVEAAGGVLVPLGPGALSADVMARLGLPVLLVSPSGLGAINHALLSLEALRSRALTVLGVVLCDLSIPSSEEDQVIRDDNALAIAEWGRTRVLARVPYLGEPIDWEALERCLLASGALKELAQGAARP